MHIKKGNASGEQLFHVNKQRDYSDCKCVFFTLNNQIFQAKKFFLQFKQ